MLILTSCPDCHAPAEITERFTLASTDGPVAHVAVSCLSGHHYRMPADKLPAASARRAGQRAGSRRGLVPLRLGRPSHRFQLCVHCQVNPAGFWVSGSQGAVARRPWCLSCCDDLNRDTCHITPFAP
jgi:hypothetical protein